MITKETEPAKVGDSKFHWWQALREYADDAKTIGFKKRVALTAIVSVLLYALFGGVGYCANAQLFPGVIACLVVAVALLIFLFIKGKVLIMPNVKGYAEFDEANAVDTPDDKKND